MTTLISLLSEHLLPNYLLAKELAGQYDRHVFITTQRMGEQGMTARFCNALKIDEREVQIIVVSEDDLPDALAKLDTCKVSLWKPKELDSENRPINNPPEYLDEIMYKLAAVSKEFGLRVNPYIFIKNGLTPTKFNDTRKSAIVRRMKILGIKGLIGSEELKQKSLII
jgi:hypothetical protein